MKRIRKFCSLFWGVPGTVTWGLRAWWRHLAYRLTFRISRRWVLERSWRDCDGVYEGKQYADIGSLGTLVDSLCRRSLSSPLRCADPMLAGIDNERIQKALIKIDIINRIADRTGVPKLKAEQAVDALFHSMKAALTRGDRIELRGFGVFVVKPRKRGVGRNPRTGQEVPIPSGKTIRFKPGKEMQVREDGEESGDKADPSLG